MSSVSYQIPTLLDKMTSTDKDLRFMATNDLMVELQKDSIKLDDDSERKVVNMLLRLLADKNGEVQNLAVKCLGPLVSKVKAGQVEAVVDTLCCNMLSSDGQLRDISSIALKTVVNELPPPAAAGGQQSTSISCRVIVQLCRAVSESGDVSVQLEALDIMSDLLARFGSTLLAYHSSVLQSLSPLLDSSRLAVRKRTITALGHLVLSCNNELYQELIRMLLDQISGDHDHSTLRTYINAVAAICREAGHRFGEYLETALPLVTRHCHFQPASTDNGNHGSSVGGDDGDDELREQCLLALEAFVHKCPREVTRHIPAITELCLHFICHDPNYNYSADDDVSLVVDSGEDDAMSASSSGRDAGDDDLNDAGDDEDDYSDDDDMSWKVRRAAAKCLDTVVSTRPELLMYFYRTVSSKLLCRFKEREENVKLDVFNVYMSIVRQTRVSVSAIADTAGDVSDTESPVTALLQQLPLLVSVVHRQLREHSTKTRQGCFALLSELIAVRRGVLADHISRIMPGVQSALSEQSEASNMKIDTLVFVRRLLIDHPSHVFHRHVARLLPCVLQAVADPFYKITAEALHVLLHLVRIIRPLDAPTQLDFGPLVAPIYAAVFSRLLASDLDQEVKERAIGCMGQVVASMGDHLTDQLSNCLPVLLDRLRNEMTRLATVRALTVIASSPLPHVDLSAILPDTLASAHTFLRKNQRPLKLDSLQLLEQLVAGASARHVSPDQLQPVLLELPPLLQDTDLHVAQRALALLTRVCQQVALVAGSKPRQQPLVDAGTMCQVLLPPIMQLTRSPLLQGTALLSVTQFFSALVSAALISYESIVAELVKPVVEPSSQPPLHKQAYTSISQCVAAVVGSDAAVFDQLVPHFMRQIAGANTSDHERTLALLCIGEIGKRRDMSAVPRVLETALSALDSGCEEVKHAGSHAIGLLTSGNMDALLPRVLHQIDSQPKHQYLLLHSLKEIISGCAQSQTGLHQYEQQVWHRLVNHCDETEEGTRNVVAECIGRLTLLSPQQLLPRLQQLLLQQAADRPLMRSTIVTAVKFTICDRPQPVDQLLRQYLPAFLATLADPLPQVRRVALVTLNSAAHNKPGLVRDLLDQLLPLLYAETKIRKELIREVEMGPFKHKVDDGLDLRKVGYECMYTLLDSCLDRLDVFTFLNHVEDGLRDDYDIKMLTHMMLIRLADLVPNAVLQRLGRLVEPLRATCSVKVKQNSVKQEFEKQDELKRSALRVTVALMAIPDADKNPQLSEFVTFIKSGSELRLLFDSVQQDSCPEPSNLMDLS